MSQEQGPETGAPQPIPGRGGRVVPHAPVWHQRLAAWTVFLLLRAVSATLRWRWSERSGGPAWTEQPAIYCIWHNRLATCMKGYRVYRCSGGRRGRFAVMVSASKDGAFLTAILECFGVQPARGSSSRRGPQALREMNSWAGRGYDLGITPDGPRGPRYVVQDGVIALAQLTGLPIVPFVINLGWKIQLKSWDRFQIPLPFSRCDVIISAPIHVPKEATAEEREQCRLRVQEGMMAPLRD